MQTKIRRTKIICTLGPATASEEVLEQLIETGMNVARFNFSHGSHEEHLVRVNALKKASAKLNKPVARLLDTKGPEIRTLLFVGGKTALVAGEKVVIRHDDMEGTEKEFSISYKELHEDVRAGSRILIDDGLLELVVEKIENKDIHCHIENGGPISNNKSVNVPGAELQLPAFTDKDKNDILFAIREDFDYIAVSFVRKATDIESIREILKKEGGAHIQIIAKIENEEGCDNFEEILQASDGIMVARGDLGVEIPPEDVPIQQKRFIKSCQDYGKISITATQMLDSMIRNPRPTRAEVSDVANAIFDGTSAVMLSGETAAGKYPVETLRLMTEVLLKTEGSIDYWNDMNDSRLPVIPAMPNAISHATYTTAKDLDAAAIITLTLSGNTAHLVSRFRPGCPIIASTTNAGVQRQLNLCWGVYPICINEANDIDKAIDASIKDAVTCGLLENGDTIVATLGTPIGIIGSTNTIRAQKVGDSFS